MSAQPFCSSIARFHKGPPLPCHVLIVDDDELNLIRISALLERSGYQVSVARSGKEALRVVNSTGCQIVITAWHTADLDGMDLCRQIHLRADDPYMHVLVLTAPGSCGAQLAELRAGTDDYVANGAPAEEILACLQVARRITHLERSLRPSNPENRRLSITDALTGSRNYRFLMKYLPREIERSRRSRYPLTILSCDIDFFKHINDRYGHAVGDEVLQGFVTRISACLRKPNDWIARTGGQEFILVMPKAALQTGRRVAARLRAALADSPIVTSSGPIILTVSIGVTALETNYERCTISAAALLRAADRCLYESKNQGRNCATVASIANAAMLSEAQH